MRPRAARPTAAPGATLPPPRGPVPPGACRGKAQSTWRPPKRGRPPMFRIALPCCPSIHASRHGLTPGKHALTFITYIRDTLLQMSSDSLVFSRFLSVSEIPVHPAHGLVVSGKHQDDRALAWAAGGGSERIQRGRRQPWRMSRQGRGASGMTALRTNVRAVASFGATGPNPVPAVASDAQVDDCATARHAVPGMAADVSRQPDTSLRGARPCAARGAARPQPSSPAPAGMKVRRQRR
jgi:hypothetical protein